MKASVSEMHLSKLAVGALDGIEQTLIGDVITAVTEFGCVLISQTERPAAPSVALPPLGRIFGRPIHDTLSDEKGIHPIRHIPGYPEYANTVCGDLQLHTDGTFQTTPPAVMLMYSETPSPTGGLSTLASGDALYAYLRDTAPEALPGLARPDAFRIRRDAREAAQAVFSRHGGRLRLAFRHAEDLPMEVHPEARRGCDLIRGWLSDPANSIAFRLEAGQILIFDNTRILHGRTAFPRNSRRSLFGLWCDGVSGREIALGIPDSLVVA